MTGQSFPNQPLTLIICGPTSSGKTSIAIQLAKELKKCNILCADSRQIYQGLDILTGKDTPPDLPRSITVFGQSIVPQDQEASVSLFASYAQKVIKRSQRNHTPLIIVGGTGLYLKALCYPFNTFSLPPDSGVRQKLSTLSITELQTRLKKLDQNKFNSLNHSDAANPRRLIRAIEIATSPPQNQPSPILDKFMFIGIKPPQDLVTLIEKRVRSRLEQGAVEEVVQFDQQNPSFNPAKTSLGYRLILDYYQKKITQEDLIGRWIQSDFQYAKRQMVWFKKQPGIIWYDKDNALKAIKKELIKQIQYA